MRLREAVLCIDCEFLYSHSNNCPQCGSQVSYPLGRALNRPVATAGLQGDLPSGEPRPRSRAVVEMAARSATLQKSA